jgi:hypothetical protein
MARADDERWNEYEKEITRELSELGKTGNYISILLIIIIVLMLVLIILMIKFTLPGVFGVFSGYGIRCLLTI